MTRYSRGTLIIEIVLVLVAAIFMIPLVTLVSVALRDPDATTGLLGFTWPLRLENLTIAWTESAMGASLVNSVIITAVSVGALIIVASMASYIIARRTERWSQGLFYLFLSGFLFPGQLAMVPLYLLFSKVGLVGNPISVIIISVGGSLPFTVFLYTAFLRDLPRDYEEAATLDGAGPVRTFFAIVLPLVRPATGTVAILTALSVWNDFLNPPLYLSGGDTRTAPLSVYSFVGEYSANWPLVFSAMITSVIPILLAYLILQKYVIQGFSGGVKG